MKKYGWLMATAPILGVIMFVCMIMVMSGAVSLTMNGFAVDTNGQLYIGQANEIMVLKDGECVKTLSPKTSRGYAFTIENGEQIVLSTSTTVFIMDLDGAVISQYPDEGTQVFNRLKNPKTFVDIHGTEYTRKNVWGRPYIYKDGIEVYSMPLRDYAVGVTMVVVGLLAALSGLAAAAQRFHDLSGKV